MNELHSNESEPLLANNQFNLRWFGLWCPIRKRRKKLINGAYGFGMSYWRHPPIQPTDAPLRVSRASKSRKENNEIPLGILIDIKGMNWVWCRFCLVTSPTTTTNRTALLQDNDDALQTLQCHHVKSGIYLFICFYPCTQTQTTQQNTHRRRLWSDEKNDEKKERKWEKRRKKRV